MAEALSPLEMMDELAKIAEFCGGYRAKCEEAGFTPAIAEQMALQLHANLMAQMERNSLPGAHIDGCQGSAKPDQSDGWDDACRCGHVRASHQMHVGRCTICECAQFDGSPSQSDGGLADA